MMEVEQFAPFDTIARESIDEFASFAREAMDQGVSRNYPEYHYTDAHTDILEAAKQYGLKFVGRGSNRMVLATPTANKQKFALKVGFSTNFRDATDQNRVETLIWNALEAADEPYTKPAKHRLTPVVASDPDNYWLVMPHGDAVTESDEEQMARDTIHQEFPFIPHDADLTLPENIIKHRGRYTVCDYGSYIPASFIQHTIGAEYLDHVGHENLA